MDKRTLDILEYGKIIEKLAAECCSQMTREAALKLHPSYKPLWIADELQGTEEAVTVITRKGTPPLGNFYDISGIVHLAAKEGNLTTRQLLQVAYNLNSAIQTKKYLSNDLPKLPRIDGLVSAICVLESLYDEITRCILTEDEIADSASPELKHIRKAIFKQNEDIRQKLSKIANSSSNKTFLQDSVVTMRQGRYVIPVKQEYKSQINGIVHDQSSSGATLFVEPQVIVEMNNELRELEIAEQKEIQRILEELSSWVGRNELAIKANQEILFKLDYLFAKGRLACNMRASRPEVNTDGQIVIKRGRHPLIDQKKVVPINVELGVNYDTLVVTGPNTGGKTVTLKTVGLICLMAQAGLFVPADYGTSLPIFRNIYADIGDEQSIEQSLSTFSSHMKNIVEITEGANKDCLVLLDELGAGTDPTEGAALAISVLDKLYSMGAKTIATTHYTELKKYALSTEGVENASMEFDIETLSPTYRLIIGVAGKSNAFEISKKLGLKDEIIDKARTLLQQGDIAFEDVLTSIEADKKAAENERVLAESFREQIEKEKEKIVQLEEKLKNKKEELLEEAKAEAQAILNDAEESAKELQKALNNKDFEEAKKVIRTKKKKYAPKGISEENPEPPSADEIEIGMRVNVISVGEKGVVLSLPDDKGNIVVQIGSMKLTVKLSSVSIVKENITEKQREKVKYSKLTKTKAMTVPSSINVIGKNLDEAEMIVEKYIDDAFLAGKETVEVIHGRGAGILREGLGKMLKQNKNVKSIRKGEYKEGGDGVTVVTLKK
ncbi:MAG: endonuclease MutS2 [Bacillota bacterium]|nr:endonuclease MutS2 [Bacillota bacterium]